MLALKPTESQKKEARVVAKQMGELKNSFMKGARNYDGILGELVSLEHLGAEKQSCKDFDGRLKDGRTVDVKTKRTKVEPKPFYDCSISEFSLHQRCDVYVFTRYNNQSDVVYLLGYLSKPDFFSKAKKYNKGDIDTSNNMQFKTTSYNVAISDLNPIEDLL
jgi:hypothetical protein